MPTAFAETEGVRVPNINLPPSAAIGAIAKYRLPDGAHQHWLVCNRFKRQVAIVMVFSIHSAIRCNRLFPAV